MASSVVRRPVAQPKCASPATAKALFGPLSRYVLNASRPRLFRLDGAVTSGDRTSIGLSRSTRWFDVRKRSTIGDQIGIPATSLKSWCPSVSNDGALTKVRFPPALENAPVSCEVSREPKK
jgi:hypothetical protein